LIQSGDVDGLPGEGCRLMAHDPRLGADRPTRRPTVLVVGTDDWAIERAADSVEGAGVEVLRCHEPGEPAFPCNALIPGRVCPLDVGFDAVLTARARPSRELEPGEVGVVCALRTRRPLVVAGVTVGNPFVGVATSVVAEGGDAAEACLMAAGIVAADQPNVSAEDLDLRAVRR
jgi:hypothetical protein